MSSPVGRSGLLHGSDVTSDQRRHEEEGELNFEDDGNRIMMIGWCTPVQQWQRRLQQMVQAPTNTDSRGCGATMGQGHWEQNGHWMMDDQRGMTPPDITKNKWAADRGTLRGTTIVRLTTTQQKRMGRMRREHHLMRR